MVFIKAAGSYENTDQLEGTETGGPEQGPAAPGWVGGEPSRAGEAACQSGALGRDWDTGSTGQCSFPVNTKSRE